MSIRKTHPIIKILNNSLIDLPTPINISLWWNFGSLLGLCLMTQILTGLFLAIHYSNDIRIAFNRVVHISRDVNEGWLIRSIHANGASIFFVALYFHIGRGIYYSSYLYLETWNVGIILLFIVIGAAFIGYVLPWGQMSFWGATVITNLLSAIPYLGTYLVQWIWGGFAVDNATLTRFFTFHFLIPFIIAALIIIHLLFLHQTGSNNPLGISSNYRKILFHPFFSIKDLMRAICLIWILALICLMYPYRLGDVENFIPANPLVTPVHIQPEWYFLFAYAILRSIPSKLGGVACLILSIVILAILPFTQSSEIQSNKNFLVNQIIFWIYVNTVILLTWIGARPVEEPFIITGQTLTIIYFTYFVINPWTLHSSVNLLK